MSAHFGGGGKPRTETWHANEGGQGKEVPPLRVRSLLVIQPIQQTIQTGDEVLMQLQQLGHLPFHRLPARQALCLSGPSIRFHPVLLDGRDAAHSHGETMQISGKGQGGDGGVDGVACRQVFHVAHPPSRQRLEPHEPVGDQPRFQSATFEPV